jgi:hypothetical protein
LLKVKPAAAKRFTALADAERMDFGEFLEHMLERRSGPEEGERPMTDHVMTEMDEHLSREDRVLAKLRRRAEDYARNPPEIQPSMWPVIVNGVSAGLAMLAAGSVFAKFFL